MMIYECVSCLWLQRREYLFPLLRGDKGCVIFLSINENSHTPCPLSRGETDTTGRYRHTYKSSFTGESRITEILIEQTITGNDNVAIPTNSNSKV